MTHSSLDLFIAGTRSNWGPISTPLVASCRQRLAELTLADRTEEWLAALHADRPEVKELHRDPDFGFMLLAHAEPSGLYRPPHDHGRAWVLYAVQSGALEVGTYAPIADADGQIRLVRRDTSILLPGEARAYLPGDIHDTRCIDDAILFRFTERDLRREDRIKHLVTRYVEKNGQWTAPTK